MAVVTDAHKHPHALSGFLLVLNPSRSCYLVTGPLTARLLSCVALASSPPKLAFPPAFGRDCQS